MRSNSLILLLLVYSTTLAEGPTAQVVKTRTDFAKTVAPIFVRHCTNCHGSKTQKAELDLSSLDGVRRGSESGSILDLDEPDSSRLLEVLRDGEMPPENSTITNREIEHVAAWIAKGADSEHLKKNSPKNVQLNQHDVIPIVLLRCASCHGRQVQEGGLDLRTPASMLRGGKSGPAIVAGNPNQSLMIQRILSEEMPPRELLAKHSVKPVEPRELEILTQWIQQGAPTIQVTPDEPNGLPDPLVNDSDRQFWSFQSPTRPPVPAQPSFPSPTHQNPIDAFVFIQIEKQGLEANPRADAIDLIRRATYDLTGLPPTPDEIDEFLNDNRPAAWNRLIDRLLSSPQYGERWGQYWLDLAGYADSEGVQHSDPIRPEAWRYRDYVIRAYNGNKPYDRMLYEQIAGDELADYRSASVITQELYENLVATGFLRMTSDGTFAGITGFVPNRLDVIDDQIRVLSSAVMGLTIRCARCHSHKFDPIPQRDYYRLAAILKPAMDEHDWLKPVTGGAAQAAGDFRYLKHVTTVERTAWETSEQRINEQIETLKRQSDEDSTNKELIESNNKRIKQLESQRRPEPKIRALWDRGEPSPTYLLKRGDYRQPGRLVGPGVPSVLTNGQTQFPTNQESASTTTTGNRLALARWLTSHRNPLTARVFVNRVWRHHFGAGLVSTLDNFGRAGATPSHPKLLDWLAVEFMESSWDIKHLHRLMMTSATYQQSSTVTDTALSIDPENRWLGRMPLRRLDAEELRDSLLAVSGQLNFTAFGPADPIVQRADGLVESQQSTHGYRRSIYLLKRRTQRLTILDNFDRPRMSPNCVDRTPSTVAPQALLLMNNGRIHSISQALAQRVIDNEPNSLKRQLADLQRLATSRHEPAHRELLLSSFRALKQQWTQHLQAMSHGDSRESTEIQAHFNAMSNLSHALLNSAEFLFVP